MFKSNPTDIGMDASIAIAKSINSIYYNQKTGH